MRPASLLLVLSLLLPAGLPAAAQAPGVGADAAPFSFVAFGDMPYCSPARPQDCAAEEGRVARLVDEINEARPAFSIFVGDTKGGSDVCTDAKLLGPFAWMSLSAAPLVYTPGDNEWTDVYRDFPSEDPLVWLQKVRKIYFAEERSLGRAPIPLYFEAAGDVVCQRHPARVERGDCLAHLARPVA